MYANANTIRMPTNYVDMDADEIEYGAGFCWLPVSVGLSIVGWGCTYLGKKTGNKYLSGAGTALTFVGIASTCGGIGAGLAIAKGASMTTIQGAEFAYNCSIGVLDGIVGTAVSCR